MLCNTLRTQTRERVLEAAHCAWLLARTVGTPAAPAPCTPMMQTHEHSLRKTRARNQDPLTTSIVQVPENKTSGHFRLGCSPLRACTIPTYPATRESEGSQLLNEALRATCSTVAQLQNLRTCRGNRNVKLLVHVDQDKLL